MFIFHINKKMILRGVVCVAALALLLVAGNLLLDREVTAQTAAGAQLSLKGDPETSRQEFLLALGVSDAPTPKQVMEIVLPATFDDTYIQYNEIQKKSGFDLEKLKGKTLKKFTYHSADKVVTLLVFKGEIVGGDITPLAQGSAMQPLFEKANLSK